MTISSCLPVLRTIDITLHAYKVVGIGIGPAVFVCHKIASNPARRCDDVMHMGKVCELHTRALLKTFKHIWLGMTKVELIRKQKWPLE